MIECPQCTVKEQYVLQQLQTTAGVKDKTALAVIMGNIKQESGFVPNICEGGARTTYSGCLWGGYGLVQWTSTNRYKGLGKYCMGLGKDPSKLQCQTEYMIHEMKARNELNVFQQIGKTFNHYMNHAYRWLGWGIHGSRSYFAKNYLNKFTSPT